LGAGINFLYVQVIQRFRVVYHGISHESLVFSRHTHEPLGEYIYQENTSDKWYIPWYATRKCCITILYHAIENTVANTINATYAQRTMGRLGVILSENTTASCILIGCIFHGMVYNLIFCTRVYFNDSALLFSYKIFDTT